MNILPVKLSVALTTYNHEKYIAQSLDSILSQNVNFSYEIVIGEDKSTDKTLQIVKEYQAKYPDKIRVLTYPQNLGYTKNFDLTMQACNGEYVAIFDGDDIMFQNKLQKQVDFLDLHEDCVMAAHPVREFVSETNKTLRILKPPMKKTHYTIEDLILHNSIFANSSKVFRRKYYPSHGINPSIRYIADHAVTMDIVGSQKIGLIDEILSDYRVHSTSIMRKLNFEDDINDRVIIMQDLSRRYDNKYDNLFYNPKAYLNLIKGLAKLNEFKSQEARSYFIESIKQNYRFSPTIYFYLISSFLPNSLRTKITQILKK
jgi:glycosyltransferase involved in cell wall biosynthesis